MPDDGDRARAFLAGTELCFEEADALWQRLKKAGELSLARRVLEQVRDSHCLLDGLPANSQVKRRLCQQEALLTSKDPELGSTLRHDAALRILCEVFDDLDDPAHNVDAETLGIAGGIVKRRWLELGQSDDLRRAARFYGRAAQGPVGVDAYPHINAAFVEDLLARAGDDADARGARARALRERIVAELPLPAAVPPDKAWFNAMTRAEAHFGLGNHAAATEAVATCPQRPEPWQLETTARQIATLAHLQTDNPLEQPEIRAFFEALLPGASSAVRSSLIGKVGLALSGGGFRASFYHLGVLARLAELDVLRHVDVLSCVSGGSIVGMCYWLALRRRLSEANPLEHDDYLQLVREVMQHFLDAVATDLRHSVQPSKAAAAWRLLRGEKGVLDPELAAQKLEDIFYRPLLNWTASNGQARARPFMHDLRFRPADHDPKLTQSNDFNPTQHNWLRAHKVPVLVINATTVNTGHAWQFTPTWMGESPWAMHEAADSIPRLEWSTYEPQAGWQMELGRAVAASACVPGVFAPLQVASAYPNMRIQLVDGGVHDNQGVVALLAHDCNVLLVSDACGQLLLEEQPKPGPAGLASYAQRSMDTLMERVRLAMHGDLSARQLSGLLRGLMFLHMKAGLDADPIRLKFSQASYTLDRRTHSPSGVRKDFQQALAELRTDLDAFSLDESHALMACGYQMCGWSFERCLARLKKNLASAPKRHEWPFKAMLGEITSTAAKTPRRDEILADLREGKTVRL
ncbi:patatin-like phospholipase family protein [Aquabacterium humicola]|uniref:patatin-like phospholipase family protein n=1 Tax=Aquabacterium humicola TaxID=3237377 RepID=UPI0025433369|nr:patatin-like phospholipase family protein [Rubrivivax pictus]